MFFNFEHSVNRIAEHTDDFLLTKARSVIPKERLEISSLRILREKQKSIQLSESVEDVDETVLFETIFLTELLKWFKTDFFKWFDKPTCSVCKVACKYSRLVVDYPDASVDVVEVYHCIKCAKQSLFHRYNDTHILIERRIGRCQEHAQAFDVICKALNYDCRMVYDIFEDHIWNEIYSDLQRRWIHCDPSEGILDKPLMYEVGWNKNSSYIVAIGNNEIQEVTWRYRSEEGRIHIKRDRVFDNRITLVTSEYRNLKYLQASPVMKKYLLRRLACDVADLLAYIPKIEGSYDGRRSGPVTWRLDRGEIGSQLSYVSYVFDIKHMTKKVDRFELWYSANVDAYLISDDKGNYIVKHGWQKYLDSYKNIIRNVESDWKMTYLAREDNSETGILKWRFKTDTTISIYGIFVLSNFFVCEKGKAVCHISTNGDDSSSSFGQDHISWRQMLPRTKEVIVGIQLSGGTGTNAWQHAQLARQSMADGPSVSFGIVLFLERD